LTDYPIEEMQQAIPKVMNNLVMNPPPEPVDPNMSIAYECAELLGHIDSIPESLKEVIKRAKYLDFVDKKMIMGSKLWEFNNKQQIQSFLANMDEKSIPWIYDIADRKQRISITLRLWAGCLDAAKNLRDKTATEQIITPERRARAFKGNIDLKASSDPIYFAGVEAAPILKKLRNEPIFTDGIPLESPVMNHLNV
jgi:hypothetical protein